MTAKPPSKPAVSAKPAAKPAPKKPAAPKPGGFFKLGGVNVDYVADEQAASQRHAKLVRIVTLQTFAIALLSFLFLLALPFFSPAYQYFARNPKNQTTQLVALTMPNMTNRAILSWATTSITEIMTIGFGDYQEKLSQQRPRFTDEGWDAFRDAFIRQKIGESFKQRQLVLTTVPRDTPVIVAQGVNEKHVYEWHVQLPVIMTYATNSNVTGREKPVIELKIIRVKPEQNPSGIGIDSWTLKN